MERIKAVRGNKQRMMDVFNWLKEQGGNPSYSDCYSDERMLFFVVKATVFTAYLGNVESELVEIIPLPRWRAKFNEDYFFVSSIMTVNVTQELNEPIDGQRWEKGNYFQTSDEASEYATKLTQLLIDRF